MGKLDTTTCDFCFAEFLVMDRHVVTQPRPSDPTDLCAVMWACPTCGTERRLPTADQLVAQHEAGGLDGVETLTI